MAAAFGNVAALPLTLPFAPGQGPYSVVRCLISTDDVANSSPVWTDYTRKMRSYSFDVGRESERGSFETGIAEVEIDNNDRALDPNAHAEVGPRNRLWLLEEFDGKTRTRFRGYVESYQQKWDRSGVKDASVVVRAADEMKMVNAAKLPVFDPPSASSYQDVVQQESPAGYWRWEQFTPMTTLSVTTYVEPPTDEDGNLIGPDLSGYPVTTVTVSMPGWVIPAAGGGYAIANDSAVVGDLIGSVEDGAGGCLMMNSAGHALDADDINTGDMLGSTNGSIEFWFKKAGNPGANTTFWQGPQKASEAVRQWWFSLNTGGTITANVRDNAAVTRTVTSSALANDTWYHVCITAQAGDFLIIYINGVLSAATAFPNLWSSSTATNPMGLRYAGATVSLDEMAIYPGRTLSVNRIFAHYTAGTARGYPQQTAGVRIGAVLDTITSQAPRFLQVGSRTMHPAFMAGRSPLEETARCEQAEGPDGAFFCTLDGTLTFLDAGHRSVSPWNTSQATFDDDGTDLPYMAIEGFDENDSFIVNEWNLSRIGAGSVTQTATDATSKSRYGPSPQSISDLPLIANADLATIAAALLAKYKDPLSRVTALVPKTVLPDVQTAVLDLDLMDKITTIRRPPGGGSAITQAAWIQKWSQSGTPGLPPTVKLSVSPL